MAKGFEGGVSGYGEDVSFFNENEHSMGGARYTRCWDQLRPMIDTISPTTRLEGSRGP